MTDSPANIPTPWCDCKVAFAIEDTEPVWAAWSHGNNEGLPPSWELCETDTSSGRAVAVFRVNGQPTADDGETVLRLLSEVKELWQDEIDRIYSAFDDGKLSYDDAHSQLVDKGLDPGEVADELDELSA